MHDHRRRKMKSIIHDWKSNPERRTLYVALILFGLLILTAIPVFAAVGTDYFDQCANGSAGTPQPWCPGTGTGWTNGNVNAIQAQWQPGEVVPQRLAFKNVVAGTAYSVTISWSAWVNAKVAHSYDYLANYDETATSANPCDGHTDCHKSVGASTFPIPVDPTLYTGGSAVCGFGAHNPTYPRTANFTIWNGTIKSLSPYVYSTSKTLSDSAGISGGCLVTSTDTFIGLTLTFTATSSVSDTVIAWGGHISSDSDWPLHAAPFISGSPYHMFVVACGDPIVGCGSQDNQVQISATPTAVTLSKFGTLEVVPANVTLAWDTASEVDTAGFNVYRADSKDGPYARINAQLIPSTADKVVGGKYQYQDKSVKPGKTYFYRLEDVELGGDVKGHDPISVNVPADSFFDSTLVRVGSIVSGLVIVVGGLMISLKKLNVF
jgi:hypothetical protein